MPTAEYCFLGIDHWSTCLAKAEWAAWLQALFSVIAIVAATVIAAKQSSHAMRLQGDLRRTEGLRQLDIAITLAERAVWLIEAIPNAESSEDDFLIFVLQISPNEFDYAATNLRKLGPENVPTGSVLMHATALAHLMDRAAELVRDEFFRNSNFRSANRTAWNGVVRPLGEMLALAHGNRAVLRSIRDNF